MNSPIEILSGWPWWVYASAGVYLTWQARRLLNKLRKWAWRKLLDRIFQHDNEKPAPGEWIPNGKRPPMPQELRQHIFQRDGYSCQIPKGLLRKPCGQKAGWGVVLQPHHWLPWKWFPGLFYATWNNVTACQKCNLQLGAKIPLYARNWDNGGDIIGLAYTFKRIVVQPDRRIIKRAA